MSENRVLNGSARSVVICLAGNLCSPDLFDRVRFGSFEKVKLDYLRECPSGDVEEIGAWLVRWVRTRHFAHVVLAGYSAGGVIAISAASKAPELFDALILSNTGPSAEGNSKSHFVDDLRAHGQESSFQRNFLSSCFLHVPSEEVLERLVDYALDSSFDRAIEVSQSLRQRNYDQAIRAYRNPVLVLWGEKDTRRTAAARQKLVQCLPQAEVHLLPAGHTPMWDCPDEYSRLAGAFLEPLSR